MEENEKGMALPEAENFIEREINKDLSEGVYSQVVTRCPPEPNGYMHIGHMKAICIDFGTAAKYGGRCNLRFDDTNPAKEDTEYVDSIMEDIRWMGFQWDHLFYASEYYDKLYEFAEILIQKGLAVMDTTATSMCMDNHIDLIVFNMNQEGNIKRAVMGESIGTIVE